MAALEGAREDLAMEAAEAAEEPAALAAVTSMTASPLRGSWRSSRPRMLEPDWKVTSIRPR